MLIFFPKYSCCEANNSNSNNAFDLNYCIGIIVKENFCSNCFNICKLYIFVTAIATSKIFFYFTSFTFEALSIFCSWFELNLQLSSTGLCFLACFSDYCSVFSSLLYNNTGSIQPLRLSEDLAQDLVKLSR